MSFHIHGFKGESYSIEIDGSEVRYRAGEYFLELNSPWQRVRVPRERLESFVESLEEIGAFKWKERYFCPAFDGVGWKLEVRSGHRRLVAYGSNAFPSRLNELQLRIAWLVQARFGIAVNERDCREGEWWGDPGEGERHQE